MDLYDKALLKDPAGKLITQGLFLEHMYEPEKAIFTLKDEDYEYKGKLFFSLKRLYLEMEDVAEFEFASTYFVNWRHWERIANNKALSDFVDQMRFELELKLRSKAINDILKIKPSSGSFPTLKWISEGGWNRQSPGRPNKAETEREKKIRANLKNEFEEDIKRMSDLH